MSFITERDVEVCLNLDVLLSLYLDKHNNFRGWNRENYSTEDLLKWCLIKADRKTVEKMVKELEELCRKEGLLEEGE